ncbi:ATP-binding cassette domain-containing protein [Mycoplasma sp. Ms02]|uniref:ATP-binding cassette domain-containing protein n=1 Tax=Mycoplasma sp. Ms02 TaxID=353851 RepID=UPI00351D3702
MIELKNVTFRYRPDLKPALKNVNLKIEDGQYVAVLGHNGSGKSTLSKVLVALLKPQEGSVEIDGIKYASDTKKDIRKKNRYYLSKSW